MKDSFRLDITDIQIIVHKTEEANFRFFNRKRSFDGFVMMTEGSGFATDKYGKKHKFSKGDIIITNKGDNYLVEAEEPCSYVTSGLTLETDKEVFPFFFKCKERQYDEILRICKVWQSRSWDSYEECRIGLLKFYLELMKTTVEKKNTDRDIEKATAFIHENFRVNFSGKEISEYCSVSLSYLRAKFLRQTGKTIVEYRDALRIAAAKEMLESRYFTVTEIAAELGYCDVYHFSKTFSSYTGCAPTVWAKQQNFC